MFTSHTWPDPTVLRMKASTNQKYMHPNTLPLAWVGEEWLNDQQCDRIISHVRSIEPQKLSGCGALTRACSWPLDSVFDPIVEFAVGINNHYWQYDIDKHPAAFHQTYGPGDHYQLHIDGMIAQSRKLTVVTMLSHSDDYDGGKLIIHYHPNKFVVPRTRGTVAVFLPWLQHEVTEITRGQRETVNLGFWGPLFK